MSEMTQMCCDEAGGQESRKSTQVRHSRGWAEHRHTYTAQKRTRGFSLSLNGAVDRVCGWGSRMRLFMTIKAY